MKKRIIVVDDEADIREILEVNLKSEGYDVISFSSGTSTMSYLKKNPHADLILLDIMMEGIDGYEFCKLIKADESLKKIPIMFLSAKTEEFDKVLGLEFGGDDYLAKPFGIKELKARVKALLRRTSVEIPDDTPVIRYKGIELNKSGYSLKIDGKDVKLTKTEFEMLLLFLKSPNKIFTRDNIIDSIKGDDVYVIDRTIDVHIMNLRKKLGNYKSVISTFSGVGYGFKEEI
jgi:two-component system phosphate regulon response regulator PhoB